MTFEQGIMKQAYQKMHGMGDRLEFMKEIVDWTPFVPIIQDVFFDNKETGGRPHTGEILFTRTTVLQALYGLSDEELEFQCHDRLSFRNFLGFPESIPDFSTIWKIRDRLRAAGKEGAIWDELQRQLDAKGYTIKKGVIQDASFVHADLGRKRYQKEKKAEKEGKKIEYTDKQLAHIDKDATFSVKNNQVYYGYKQHTKSCVDYGLIRDYDVTTASTHDGKINLVDSKDIAGYRDKGYFGTFLPNSVKDKTMQRATRGHPLTKKQKERNYNISKIRCLGERPYSVIKRTFDGGNTFVKTLARVKIKEMFKCFAFDLYQLVTIQKKKCLA